MNGSKLMNNSGFTLKHPKITAELLKQVCILLMTLKNKNDKLILTILFSGCG